jgi:RimJ/RimL family protein N-acetyltransferase
MHRLSSDILPRLGTACTLRRLSCDDLAAFQAYRHDAELGRYQGWLPMSDAEALSFLSQMSSAPLLHPGAWAQIGITAPDSQRLIGDIGLFLAEDGRHAEIGFTLERRAQGRGVATAAVREAIDLIFESSGSERVLAITDARNLSSVRLLERVGMRRIETSNTVFRGAPCIEYTYAVTRGDR